MLADDILHERVRSAIGRAVAYPGAVTVTATQGRITLQGDVLEDDVDDLIKQVEGVRGVDKVENQLTVHRSAEGVSSLQGTMQQQQQGFSGTESWSPAARVVVGVLGGALTYHAVQSRGPIGDTLGILGLALLTRATTNRAPRGLIESLREKGKGWERADPVTSQPAGSGSAL